MCYKAIVYCKITKIMVYWEGKMTKFLEQLNTFVWGAPALVLILGVGLYISIRTGFVQIRLFPRALRDFVTR